MSIPAIGSEWDLPRLQQIVAQNDLERGRIEYKGELGDGHTTLEAIAALANTFGGVILVGVDEKQQGLDRLTGVGPKEHDRLARMCWDKLVPPYDPEIVPVRLDTADKYVLVVLVDPERVRRPVMVSQGKKIPVRLDGSNKPADWYRLRELFAESQASTPSPGLPPSGNFFPPAGISRPDLGIRGRLLITGPRGRSHYITETARSAILATLNDSGTPLTGQRSTFGDLMHTWVHGSSWGITPWHFKGRTSASDLNAQWHGLAPGGRALTQACATVQMANSGPQRDSVTITLDALLTDPRRAEDGDVLKAVFESGEDVSHLRKLDPSPFIHLGALHRLMRDMLGTLWGPVGARASLGIFGQPLGPPAEFDIAVFTVEREATPSRVPLNQCAHFGAARLIPGNTPLPWTQIPPIKPDHQLLDQPDQDQAVREWTEWLAIHNGYENIEEELAKYLDGE